MTRKKRNNSKMFAAAKEKERLIKRLIRRRERIKDLHYRQAVKSLIAQFSMRGGSLTSRQWDYLKIIDKSPCFRKSRCEKDISHRDIKPSVYAIEANGRIKIGKSHSVEKRLKALQSANPDKLFILKREVCPTHQDALNREQQLHKYFAQYRVRGEWFDGCIKDELLMIMK